MATIALYAGKINQMPSLISDVKTSVNEYKSELFSLKAMALSVNKSVCDLDDVISSIQTSTQIQEEKIASLEEFQRNSEEFIEEVVRIDREVADVVNQNKEKFYEEYSYLNPNPEKNILEWAGDGLQSLCEWCQEHWKAAVTFVIAITAVVLICTGVGGILGAMAIGALVGAGIGGIGGGIICALTGGSFWEGFENGAFGGAIAGIISGGMAFGLTGGVADVALTLSQTLQIGAVSGAGSSLIGDLGDKLIKGDDISWTQIILNTAFGAAFGAAFSGAFYGLAKGFTALKVKFSGNINTNRGVVEFTTPKNNATPENIAQTKAYVKGCNKALKDGALSPTGRTSTQGQLRNAASKAANAERAAASAKGNPYHGHVGHVPDTTWTGKAQPYSWLDLNPPVNMSLGAQALKYPIGYQPTKFIFKSPLFNVFTFPSTWSSPFSSIVGEFYTD